MEDLLEEGYATLDEAGQQDRICHAENTQRASNLPESSPERISSAGGKSTLHCAPLRWQHALVRLLT